MSAEPKTYSIKWAATTLGIVALLVVASVVVLALRPAKSVSNFEECIDAGGARMESYPEQCMFDGKTYADESQRPIKETGYVGMKEDEALLTAEDNNTPARVVERDGESLPVTMDFILGRHNFYVRDGEVYHVEIEGQAADTPSPAE